MKPPPIGSPEPAGVACEQALKETGSTVQHARLQRRACGGVARDAQEKPLEVA
jgi:hypothetical protein